MSGHLVFLKSPRLVNIAASPRTRLGTVNNRARSRGWRNQLGYFRIDARPESSIKFRGLGGGGGFGAGEFVEDADDEGAYDSSLDRRYVN
jgi:hypothetical protein